MTVIVGVDGGGSKTRALVAGPDLRILGEGVAGSSNIQAVGLARAADAIAGAVATAMALAGSGASLDAVCLALAGAGRPEQREQLQAWAGASFGATPCTVVSDLDPVLAAGTPEGWGVALIAGTGSSCLARSPEGVTLKIGGWGYLLGDEGSGYDLARSALRLATQTADGRAQAHAVLQAALTHFGLSTADGLVARVYADPSPAAVAAFAQPVIALAAAGDPEARALLDASAAELALLASTAARRLELVAAPVALAGGLLAASPYLRERLVAALGPCLAPVEYVPDPAIGALVLARKLLRAAKGAEVRQ